MGELGRPSSVQGQLPGQGIFDGQEPPREQERAPGQLPPLDWGQVAFENQRPQQPARFDGQQPGADMGPQPAPRGDQPAQPAQPADRPLQVNDRVAATLKMEDQRTADLLIKTIKELKEAAPHRLSTDLSDKAEAELKKGEFGPNARMAYAICANFLSQQVAGSLILLDSRGLEIPTGCPLEPPVDPRSGRHIIPEWYRAKVVSGDLRLNLDVPAERVPSAIDIANMRAAGIWTTRAIFAMNSAIIESDASLVKNQVQSMNVEGGLNGWLPRKDMTDLEKEQWTQACRSWLNTYTQVRNYAHAIAQLNVDTTKSTSPDKLFGIPIPKWSTIPRQIFSDEALKDENFPGHVERNADGSIKSVRIDVPDSLDRSGPNLEKMRKLEEWLAKYAPKVDQLVREVTFAAAKEGRMLAWADVPAEGTIKQEGWNVIINQRTPDERGGFIEVPIQVLNFKTEKEAEDALKAQQLANKKDIDDGKITIKKEANEVIEYSEAPGFLLGGRKLKPGEKEFNIREFRFQAKEVMVDGQPMIEVQSTQKYQYSWLPYDIGARDMRTVVSGTTDAPVRYKPDDWVCVLDGGRTMMIQARFLPRFETEGRNWHYGMKGATIAMDVGFIAMGGFEIGALYNQTAKTAARTAFREAYKEAIKTGTREAASVAARQAAMQAAKLPLGQALKIALLSQGDWHIMLGATGIAGRPIEAGFGKYGHDFMKYRSYVMLADITWNQLYVGDMAKKAWAAARGVEAVEKTSAAAQLMTAKSLSGFLYRRLGNVMLGTEFLMIGDIIGKAVPDMLAQTRNDSVTQTVASAARLREPVFSPETPTLLRIDSLLKETEKVRALPENTKERRDQEKALTTSLTTTFLDSKNQDERLAAALALLNLKGKENAPAPENVGSRMRGQAEDVLKLSDVQKFLREYQQQQMRKLLNDYDGKMAVGNADLTLKKTAEMLALPEDNADRKRHLDKLVETFKQYKDLEDKVKQATVALEKAKQDQRDGAEKSATEKERLAKAVNDASDRLKKAKDDWDKSDKRIAAAATLGLVAFGIVNENGQGTRALTANNLKAEEVMAFMERQGRSSNSSEVRYVLGDMLFRMGRADLWQLGSVCQDVLKDNNLKENARTLKIAAMLNDSGPRIGELMELMRFDLEPSLSKLPDQKDRAKAFSHTYGRDSHSLQETLLAVVRNQKEDPDVRAMAASLLLAGSAATKEERQKLFQQCREDWQKHSAEPGRFAKQFVQTLKADLTRNTDAGDDAQRQILLDKKFRAALALSEMGGPADLGIDADTIKRTTQALIDCFDYTKPALALQVISQLIPKRLAEMTPQQLKDVRDTAQQMLGPGMEAGINTPAALLNAQARTPLRMAIIEKLPQILEGAPATQRTEVLNTLKGIASYEERYRTFFAANAPELRASALTMLVQLSSNGPDALKADTIKLLNGLVGAEQADKRDASPDVRLAALNGLEALKAPDLQGTALKLLKTEKDPRLLEKLWALEYSERRLDVNSTRYKAALADAQRKLLDSIDNSAIPDPRAFMDTMSRRARGIRSAFEELERTAVGNGPEAEQARKAAIWYMLNGKPSDTYWVSRIITRVCQQEGAKTTKEFAGMVERCLLANTQMEPVARVNLLLALEAIKPGSEGSPISKQDAAVIYATILERDLKHLPRYNVPENPIDARTRRPQRPGEIMGQHAQLQQFALEGMAKYGNEKLIPLLESLAEDNVDRDARGRLTKITYPNGKSREFVYEDAESRNVIRVIEQPSGEVWSRGDKQGDVYTWTSNKGGRRELKLALVNDLDEYIFQDKDLTFHGITQVGGEVQIKQGKLMEVTYPNGSGRRFTYETYQPFRGITNTRLKTVTELPSGEVWTRDDKDETKWTSNKGGSRKSFSEFVTPGQDRYGGEGGDAGSYCRVIQAGETPIMEVFTSSGAKVTVKMGVVTEEDSGFGRNTNIHSTHPIVEVRQSARQLLNTLRDSTSIVRAQVEQEIKLNPDSVKKTTQQMADDMAAVLGNPNSDSAAVCRSIFLNCLGSPIRSVEDPRRIVLEQALKDPHEQVRLAAAKMIFEKSDLRSDREKAAAMLADIEKNGSRIGYRRDAGLLLSDVVSARPTGTYHTDDFKLVASAREHAVNQPRVDARNQRRSGDAIDDTTVDFQKAYERVKTEIERGTHHALTLSWDQQHRWFNANKLQLLDPITFHRLQESAARKRWEGKSWEWRTSSWETIRREEEKARETQVPYLWAQFDQLINMARTLGDKEPLGIEAREHLVYIIMSGGDAFSSRFQKEAVERAANGILDICKGQGPGRGDLDWALKTLLIEQPSVDPKIRLKLVEALDELVTPKGKLSKEYAAAVAFMALETEYRNMPAAGTERYDNSVKLQVELLARLERYGNKDVVPMLEAVAKLHKVDEIKKKAAAVSDALKRR